MLFLAIAIEGYVVLACELLVIRQLVPFVGSGIETTAIVIGGVLLPLAFGYHWGGTALNRHGVRRREAGGEEVQPFSVRRILSRNIVIAMAFLGLGLPSPLLEIYFSFMQDIGVTHRLLQTSLYTLVFVVPPMFLLAQTVPLISNCFLRRQLSEITGRMLFFSTAGAFLGSIFSTIVLMTTIGVHNTITVTIGLLFVLSLLIARRRFSELLVWAAFTFIVTAAINNPRVMQSSDIVSDNAYNVVQIQETPQGRLMFVNRSRSSMLANRPEDDFQYIQYINSIFIDPIADPTRPNAVPRDILVIGAGGFTVGRRDTFNNYAFVDIDGALLDVTEKHFLREKLSPNKKFIAASARAFLNGDSKQYDLVVIDVYTMPNSIPMECVTQEFLIAVKEHLKPEGIIVANVISQPTLSDDFSVRYSNTFASVFPVHSRQIIGAFDPWSKDADNNNRNVLYLYFNNPHASDNIIYSDDRNTYSLDRP